MDSQQLELVSQFATFLDVLRKPDEILELVEKAKQATKELQETHARFKVYRSVEEYKQEVEKKLASREALVKQGMKELEGLKDAHEAEWATRMDALTKERLAVQELRQEAKGLAEKHSGLDKKEEEIELVRQRLQAKAEELAQREQVLQGKLEAVSRLMGV